MPRPTNFTDKPFEIRYAELDSSIIFNQCGPQSAGPAGFDEKSMKEKDKAAQRWIDMMNRRNQFYIKLETSILYEGIRNPILLKSGWIPQRKKKFLPNYMTQDERLILVCDANGGSRLWVAQKHKMKIPCIISDFSGQFRNEKLLETEDDIAYYYKDRPQIIEIIEGYGVRIRNLPQTHLDN